MNPANPVNLLRLVNLVRLVKLVKPNFKIYPAFIDKKLACREVATCDREPGTGSLRLGPLKCPGGLFFDIERQT